MASDSWVRSVLRTALAAREKTWEDAREAQKAVACRSTRMDRGWGCGFMQHTPVKAAERNGIPMPKRAEYADAETHLRAAVFQIQELAQEAFREQLAGPAGADARRYLEKRGVSPEVSAQFGLGYAERSPPAILRILEKQGFTAEQLEN